MNTTFDPTSESRLEVPSGSRNGDQGRRDDRRAKILELLSVLDQGTCAVSGRSESPPPAEPDRTTHEQPDSSKPARFLLADRTGPIAEFASWNAAREYMSAQQHHGATIVAVGGPKEPGRSEERRVGR